MSSRTTATNTSSLPASILLVEDNPVIAMHTEAMLADMGIEAVKVASSVAEALALVEAERFDFAILDLRLGEGEDSLPVAAALTEQGVAFVFATGFGEAIDLSDTGSAVEILQKPYHFEDLERAIARPA